ncbi:collagen-like protein [Corynebacterium minutissimum]|uniref:Collagen-like protein n=1 Tax=Corynebacterium minutissimum TaxID=38301 RepID=A0A2X4RGK0_9CORY|nr:collagen-like protein [Corynebacterium minutissimum]QPS60000.1 collagen-like protein [Corynebacterium minutissimum]QQA79210.1 collagen-like protein [Corynebacterium minutissimum]SQI01191.1 Uncharacterised protein [Corynebacterium minutissimum]VEG04742.1 Uncharacterised protein [Corynebacterium minutissimum]
MFKNRVRTAALAGAIAVATGVSGVAVPAFAEDTTTTNIQGGGFNEPDASLAKDVEAKNVTEAELRDRVAATDHYIVNNNQFRELYEAAAAANTDGLDRSEQADHKAYQAAANEATKQLAQAEKNVQDARASVAYALENDKGADKAWANYEEKAFDYNNTVTNIAGGKRYPKDGNDAGKLGLLESDLNKANAFVSNKVNDEDKSNLPPLEAPKLNPVDPEDFKSVQDTPEENIKIFKKTIETYKERLDYAGWRNADKNENSYITRDYVPLLEQLIADAEMLLEQLKEDGAALEEARKAALEASRGAQGADILVRQGYLDQAHAQVRVLRAMEAEFAIGARVLELRESDDNGTVVVNGEQKTLREAYAELIAHQTGIVSIAKQKNMETYEAQVAQFKGFKEWASDEANFDGNRIWTPQIPADFANPESPWGNTEVAVWDGGTDQERLDYLAMKVAAQQLWFGPNNYNLEYEEAYRQVVNADNGVQKEIADSQAAEEQAKNERERAEQEAKDRQRIADALENLAGGDNGKDGDKGSDGKDGDNGSDGKDGDNGSDGKDGDNNKKGDKGSAKDKLSNNGKPTPLAIFGIVAGVLAAVAAAFPAIAKALNIKLPF